MQERETTVPFKRQRLIKKNISVVKDAGSSVREGPTYSTNIALGNNEIEDTGTLEQLPAAVHITGKEPIIVFDLETTGLSRQAAIVQLSAICGEKTFDSYIFPDTNISESATRVSGLKISNGELLHNGVPVKTETLKDSIESFIDFIDSCKSASSKPILVGHNVKNYDVQVLYNSLELVNMVDIFSGHVMCFMDTLNIAKTVLCKQDVKNYKQETLVSTLLGHSYDAHNALADVTALQELYSKHLHGKFNPNMFSFLTNSHVFRRTLQPLISDKIVSAVILSKLCNSGICLRHLFCAYERDPEAGIENLLKEPTFNSVRVTKDKKIIDKINCYVRSKIEQ